MQTHRAIKDVQVPNIYTENHYYGIEVVIVSVTPNPPRMGEFLPTSKRNLRYFNEGLFWRISVLGF